VKINAEVSGEIIALPIREGQRVTKGQLLVRIKPDAYQAQLENAQAALEMANAGRQKAEADYNRAKELIVKKLISDSDMDLAKASYLSAKAGYDQANATLKQYRDQYSKDHNLCADGRCCQPINI